MIGQTISHYKIQEKLGEGGMGVVYKAEDTKLKRTVALKFLIPHILAGEDDKTRFMHEAQAAAALRHPGICTVYEIDEVDGQAFISMEYIEGESLKQKIASRAIQQEDAINIALQIVDALREAHEKGIVHRDIKPANIMFTPKGQVVLMDFGLAKLPAQDQLTKTGTTIGTAAYMSPEQACGEQVDHRTDIWSVGVVLYQMLAGAAPFKGEHEHAIVYSVLNLEPEPPTKINHDIPRELERVVLQCLRKDPSSRFASMRELHSALSAFTAQQISVTSPQQGRQNIMRLIKRPVVFIPVIILAIMLVIATVQYSQRAEKIRWATEEALPKIGRLAENQKYLSAYKLALKAQPIIPSDTVLSALWTDITAKFSIHTTPNGADVYMKPYGDPQSEWEFLGRTPIDSLDIPKEYFRWKIEIEGYVTIEAAGSWTKGRLHYELDQAGAIPEGMVKVPGGNASIWNIISYETFTVEDFYIDKFEVTNQQFKTFVDDGGYERRELWKHEFINDDRTLSWDEAMNLFRDATGRPGPATWELGACVQGRENMPVTGISWYEAAAYAEFVGKSLPTVSHWMCAASIREGAHIIPLSNFGDVGLTAVGRHQGHSEFGIYDVAGNAREWCYNASEGNRCILGGSWSDPSYSFNFLFSRRAFDRSAENGFRCARYFSGDKTLTSAREDMPDYTARDYNKEEPVSDAVFEAYADFFIYDRKPLNAQIEFKDESQEHWTVEKIVFDAAYGNERMFAYLFLPLNSSPPYQVIVLFPGAGALSISSSENGKKLHSWDAVDFVIKSGRAVLFPIYKSTFERRDGYNMYEYDPDGNEATHREHALMWWKDLARSIDYIETRKDIDIKKLCYIGSSWGAWIAPVFLALDDRYKAAILRLGGFPVWDMPSALDPINYASRVHIPVLMLNGRYDNLFPYETSQVPLFQTLGAPEKDKRHILFETAHSVHGYRYEMMKETLDWLDRYLGPVQQ